MLKTELYVSEGDLDLRSREWTESIDRKRRWPKGDVKPALLVLDMQMFFLDPDSHAYLPSGRSIIRNLKELIASFTGPIFFSKHVKGTDDNLMNIWWKDAIEGELSEIIPELAPLASDVIIKEHYSAFYGTKLEKTLRDKGVDSVVISGVMTDLCCESTTRDAFMRGFKVFFLADCTATATEERHLSTLRTISNAFGEVLTFRELMSRS
ncbi:MAG: isochorismatase family protein [Thermoplasmatota archaeon]